MKFRGHRMTSSGLRGNSFRPNIAVKSSNLKKIPKIRKVPLRILPLSDIYPYHHCKDQYSDEYVSVPTEPFSKNQPRRNLRETFSQIFQKTRSLQNLRNNISNLGIYAQPKERFQITPMTKLEIMVHINLTGVIFKTFKGHKR